MGLKPAAAPDRDATITAGGFARLRLSVVATALLGLGAAAAVLAGASALASAAAVAGLSLLIGLVVLASHPRARRISGEAGRRTRRLAEILREMPDGIQVFDPAGRMIAWNEQLFAILDIADGDRDAILAAPDPGRAFRHFLAARGDYGPGDPEALVAEREARARARVPVHFRRPATGGRWLDVRAMPTRSGDWLGIYRDVTDEVRRESELEDASRQLEAHAAQLRATADDLAKASAEAEAANRAKSVFLTTMSHELRTPLNGILGFTELMSLEVFGPLGDARYKEYLADIETSGRHLLALINDILDLSRLDAERLELNEQTVDVATIVGDALRMVRPRAEGAGLRLAVENLLPEEAEVVLADERRLRQVVLNLVANAVKFTPAGGSVTVRLETTAPAEPRGIAIRIADTGIGIAADQLERVFEPFAQIEDGLDRRHEGTGLGLPLARRLTELHGGRIAIASEPGRGTCVSVLLPASRIRPWAAARVRLKQGSGRE